MTTALKQKMRFVSRPYQRRIALVSVIIAVVLAWWLLALSLALAVAAVQHNALWGSMSLVVVCGFAVYMVFLTYDLVKDSQQRYELLIDGDQISLSSYDKQQRSRINQQISLREVTSAEYYEPRDTSSLLLKGRSTTLEIPLWSFGPEAEKKIVLHVKKMGVQIVGIPNDVVI